MKAFVIARDRLTYVRRSCAALFDAGMDVYVVDHGTTYEPLLRWYDSSAAEATGVLEVFRRGDEHPRSLWEWPTFRKVLGDVMPYVVTDPDVVPAPGCPRDWPTVLRDVLQRNPGWVKAGLSLRTSDLPARYAHAARVREWEAQHSAHEQIPGWWTAGVDTTLAVYRPLGEAPRFSLHPALRSMKPYEALHLTWYEDSSAPTKESRWYAAHLPPLVSHWSDPAAYEGGHT